MEYLKAVALLYFIYFPFTFCNCGSSPFYTDYVSRLDQIILNGSRKETDNFQDVHEVYTSSQNTCQCVQYECGCCKHMELDEIHLNSTVCVNITYLPKEYGLSFVMTLNEYTIYNETISVKNPPPICVGMPFVEEFAEICVRLYNIDTSKRKFYSCLRVEARMKRILVAKYELGCFTIPLVTAEGENELSDVRNGLDLVKATFEENKLLNVWNGLNLDKVTVKEENKFANVWNELDAIKTSVEGKNVFDVGNGLESLKATDEEENLLANVEESGPAIKSFAEKNMLVDVRYELEPVVVRV